VFVTDVVGSAVVLVSTVRTTELSVVKLIRLYAVPYFFSFKRYLDAFICCFVVNSEHYDINKFYPRMFSGNGYFFL